MMKVKLIILCCILQTKFGAFAINLPILTPPVAPYFCSVVVDLDRKCDCAIITDEYVLSSAGCLLEYNSRHIQILVGTNNLDNGGTYYGVQKTIVHENYTMGESPNDIGIIKTSQKLEFNAKVQPIRLGSSCNFNISIVQKPEWDDHNILEMIDLTDIELECRRNPNPPTSEKIICTMGGRGRGACHGDSGGPLVINGELCGAVSWSMPCALGVPLDFIIITPYLPWINQNTV